MERFALLVGICLLLAKSATAVPTIAGGRVSGTHHLSVAVGNGWLTPGTVFLSVRGSGFSFGTDCTEAGGQAPTKQTRVREAALRIGLGRDDRLLSREDGTCDWFLHADSLHVGFGWGVSEGYESTLADQLLAAVLNGHRSSIGTLQGPALPLTGGRNETLLAEQEDMPGLAASPGAVVVGSLGLGLLGWLRKRATW
jgi:hypothetical protein